MLLIRVPILMELPSILNFTSLSTCQPDLPKQSFQTNLTSPAKLIITFIRFSTMVNAPSIQDEIHQQLDHYFASVQISRSTCQLCRARLATAAGDIKATMIEVILLHQVVMINCTIWNNWVANFFEFSGRPTE